MQTGPGEYIAVSYLSIFEELIIGFWKMEEQLVLQFLGLVYYTGHKSEMFWIQLICTINSSQMLFYT